MDITEVIAENGNLSNLGKKVKEGSIVVELHGQPQPVRLQVTQDSLNILKEELVYTQSPTEDIDPKVLASERTVEIIREAIGGLGLSVKGGAEHNLPVLVSRIFKDQSADKTGQLYVGDAILEVNGTNIESYTHDEAVTALKNAGDKVMLVVKYFKPASLFLTKNKRNSKLDRDADNNPLDMSDNSSCGSSLERQWTIVLSIPLLCAYVTRYRPQLDQTWSDGFEVVSYEGETTGVIHCEDTQSLCDWTQTVMHNINTLNSQSMILTNQTLIQSQHVHHMCWVCELVGKTRFLRTWNRQFLAFKGQDVCMFDTPPVKTRDWVQCQSINRIYECMFRVIKENELLDQRPHCCVVETGQGINHYLAVETRQDLLQLEKAWHKANYHAVKNLGAKTFGCTWNKRLSGLTLDLTVGFSLYDMEAKSYMWTYRFSQLKGSSDDGHTHLKLHFQNEQTSSLDTREIECTNLRTLLFSMHAFLSAKLASVDPAFLVNL